MQFDKDIFISYAHIDDESLISDQKGWVSEFHRVLEIRLAQLMGSKPVIWRDPSLVGNHIFDKEIVDQFAKVAIMISILTPRYVKSEWCLKEANEFRDVCMQNIGFVVNNKARIFKVIKTPVALDIHPDGIKNILGYEFYSTAPHTNRIKEYSINNDTQGAFIDKINELATDISEFLDELKNMNSVSTNKTTGKDKAIKNIFLSESSYDTREQRDMLRKDLQDHGYNIMPYGQLSLVAPVLKESVTQLMKEAQLSVHLVGNSYGIIPEGSEKSIVEIQNEIGASASTSNNLPRLVWIPEDIDPSDERQKVFLRKLESGNREVMPGADLIKSTIENFKSIMYDKLNDLEKKSKQPEPEPEAVVATNDTALDAGKRVYLICDVQDRDEGLIVELEDYLFNNGIEVVLPVFEADETVIREEHIENLKICTSAIIFFGSGNEIWLRTKMRDFMKINGYGREKPLSFKGIFLSAPKTVPKQRFRTLDAEVINGLEKFPEDEIKKLLSKL